MSYWTLAPDADLRWRTWDGECVVYHPSSGDTHILNPIAAEALHCLERGRYDAAALVTHVATHFDLPPDEALARQMNQCLAQFAELGLVVDGRL